MSHSPKDELRVLLLRQLTKWHSYYVAYAGKSSSFGVAFIQFRWYNNVKPYSTELPTVISSKFNAKHCKCRPVNPNERHDVLLTDPDTLLLTPSDPTFYSANDFHSSHILDIILLHQILWPVTTYALAEGTSDHFLIILDFPITPNPNHPNHKLY